MAYETNVFVNCPFDKEYTKLLRALVFTLLYLKLEPKLSQTLSSSTVRINQIKLFIKNSKYGIHDISRSRPMKENELPRFNMPYELGLDIGCAEFGGRKFSEKKALILETEKYHYHKVLSDISGQDIESHSDDPKILMVKVRNWLSSNNPEAIIPGHNEILAAYHHFNTELDLDLFDNYTLLDIEEMPIGDYIKFAKFWLKEV